jgi:hypothetical protein
VRDGRKPEAAVALRDDHAEEAVAADVFPGIARQIQILPRHGPVVHHGAQRRHLVVQEGLRLSGQPRGRDGVQGTGAGAAAKECAIPPDGTGLQRLAFRIGHARQRAAEYSEEGPAEPAQAQLAARQHDGCGQDDQDNQDEQNRHGGPLRYSASVLLRECAEGGAKQYARYRQG